MAAVVVGLLAGLTGWPDLAAVLVVAAFAFGWELAVSRGFSAARPALPLALLVAAIGAAALLSGQAGEAGGLLGRWVDQVPLPVVGDLDADGFLLLTGVVLLQLSTGNVLVRLVLAATGTITTDLGASRVRSGGSRVVGCSVRSSGSSSSGSAWPATSRQPPSWWRRGCSAGPSCPRPPSRTACTG